MHWHHDICDGICDHSLSDHFFIAFQPQIKKCNRLVLEAPPPGSAKGFPEVFLATATQFILHTAYLKRYFAVSPVQLFLNSDFFNNLAWLNFESKFRHFTCFEALRCVFSSGLTSCLLL